MFNLNDLRGFIDLGGVFILALLLLWGWFKKLDKIELVLTKLLALITVLVQKNTSFNHINEVLGDKKKDVEKMVGSPIDKLKQDS